MKRLLLFLSVAIAVGCGGSGGGGSATPSATVSTFISDSLDNNDHVWVTVHEIELLQGSGAVSVFDSADGVQVDLKTLRDATGARFRFMSQHHVPEGTYTGARVTLDKDLVMFTAGATTGTPMTFDSPLDAAAGKSALSLTFATPVTIASHGNDDIVIDFDLANWNEAGGIVTPVLKLGTHEGLDDQHRHEEGEYKGTVNGLTGTAPNQTFSLHSEESNDITVAIDENTQIVTNNGAGIANGSRVEVEGAFDTTTNTLKATSVRVEDQQGGGENEDEDAEGIVSTVDANAGTFVMTISEADGFLPANSTITVDANGSSTEFFALHGDIVTKEAFFSLLAAGTHVKAIGQLNTGTGVLEATKVLLKHDD